MLDPMDNKFRRYIRSNDLDAITLLLKSGTDIDMNDALQYSAECGKLDIVIKLLEYGADLHSDYDYALRWSAAHGHINVVGALLSFGASINAVRNHHFNSALELSAKNDHLDVVTKLLECGANVRINNDKALRFSCKRKRVHLVEKLLEHGANLYCNNKIILRNLCKEFDECMADAILPYCSTDDYEYFPCAYIEKRIVLIKSANNN